MMGNFMEKLPNVAALDALKGMIELGIRLGKITPDYKLYGHRDVGTTLCPGDKLYELIQTWEHFGPKPPVKPTPIPYIFTTQTLKPTDLTTTTSNSLRATMTDDPSLPRDIAVHVGR